MTWFHANSNWICICNGILELIEQFIIEFYNSDNYSISYNPDDIFLPNHGIAELKPTIILLEDYIHPIQPIHPIFGEEGPPGPPNSPDPENGGGNNPNPENGGVNNPIQTMEVEIIQTMVKVVN